MRASGLLRGTNVPPPPANDGLDGVESPSQALLETQLDSVLRTRNGQDAGGLVQVELGPGGLLEFFNGGAPLSDDD